MVTNQLKVFTIFIFIGLLIGLLFDSFRITRKTFKVTDVGTHIQDILFWILTSIIMFISIFIFNNGEIRFYIFLGIIIGWSTHLFLFSKKFISINVIILNKIKKILKYILKIFLKPITFITINIRKSIKKFNKNIKKHIIIEKREIFVKKEKIKKGF